MSITSIPSLIGALRQSRVLPSAQLDEVIRTLQHSHPDPKALAKELLDRDWLTPYQVNQLFLGKGGELLLGSYILLGRLGDGAMGQVFKARHQHMKRVVALKVIRKELLADPDAVYRFYQDIQAASQLSHPNIVHAYDAGPVGPTHFFAMEFVEGVDLERLVRGVGPLPAEQACDYVRQTALGLQHGFDKGLLHQDVKPTNLLVARPPAARGQTVKVGTALHPPTAAGWAGGPIKIRNLGLTLLHTHLDTGRSGLAPRPAGPASTSPDYLAPERGLAQAPPNVRADVYSLGCTLFFLLTGDVPFPGGSPGEKVRRHFGEPVPPVTARRSDVPQEVAAVLARMMAKRPDERFATPAAVAEALEPWTTARPAG